MPNKVNGEDECSSSGRVCTHKYDCKKKSPVLKQA